ncbi:MAG: PilZ domain-containing protein [Verrucomicrobia bacterium]|jgi:hypothetical protein|nr:PilZ domain-containing protein [Verrucomicrobiota bacterium]
MSARKAASPVSSPSQVTVQGRQTSLSLSPDAVVIHRGGIEFRSPSPFNSWTEMTLTLQTPDGESIRCSGVVVSCTGNKHVGYHVSMVFTGLSERAEAQLAAMAFTI